MHSVMKCQICDSTSVSKFFSLGHHPPCDSFLSESQLSKPETYYPLDLFFCNDCSLVQIGHVVDPIILFEEEYAYNSGSNKALVQNFKDLADKSVSRFNLNNSDLVIDIGSNDGSLLNSFIGHGVRVLGVEPTGNCILALAKGIPTLKNFFNMHVANNILSNYGNSRFITATNVFAHVVDIHGFVDGVKSLLSDDGVFVSESHHILSLLKESQYDSVYHEHLRNYSLKPLIKLFEMHDMDVFDVELISSHGGSIRVYSSKKGAFSISDNVQKVIDLENSEGVYSLNTYLEFGSKALKCRNELKQLLFELKNDGKSIVGIGAPAKGNTLLNYCRIMPDTLDYLADVSNFKIGKYSPGLHIKVVDEEKMFEDQPDYGLLLSWNIKDIIIPKLKARGFKGKFIIPVPTPHIVE